MAGSQSILNYFNLFQEKRDQPICFLANIHDEERGIKGYTLLTYPNYYSSYYDVEVNFTEYPSTDLEYASGQFCPKDINDKYYLNAHIHAYWNYDNETILNGNYRFGEESCNAAATGGHYDPQFACGAASNNNIACTKLDITPTFCEVGDLSCIKGGFFFPEDPAAEFEAPSSLLRDYYFKDSINTWSSVVFHCGENQRRMFCSKLELVNCNTHEIIDKKFFVKNKIGHELNNLKSVISHLKGKTMSIGDIPDLFNEFNLLHKSVPVQ